jgi:hypothetical protein
MRLANGLWLPAASLVFASCQSDDDPHVPGSPTAVGGGEIAEGVSGGLGGISNEPPSSGGYTAGGAGRVEAGGGDAGAISVGAPAGTGSSGAAGAAPAFVCDDGGLGQGATCQSLCEGWFPLCKELPTTADVFVDFDDCLEQCSKYTMEQLCCRGYHIKNVPKNPNSHCTHTAGFRTCP